MDSKTHKAELFKLLDDLDDVWGKLPPADRVRLVDVLAEVIAKNTPKFFEQFPERREELEDFKREILARAA